MSKMDDLRAMREARYEQRSAGNSKPTVVPVRTESATPRDAGLVVDSTEVHEALPCGHRAISGRTCTREQGHTAKSHRYS
jgi:hypothetical protein